ncbi:MULTISPECIES: SDR family NAD(P)-dependent oxidoreductase [unclassified Mycolicibacterium]|uniref:SDR family NAD(P)-dependent oxidoreductase n=1 Tax=unclassified Mycolicibacterium TaxID=2636767 RepID=UPI0012DD09CD|nr:MULTISPECIES: SDR family NAD(P)-dependent oxidoreductase [unclassified Mycolicibacterium]MUL82511.1 SDR family NAD(P)-dependent oxidoreductase [Mycolicibacterium sp. CBMA 329]MUL91357.1 SDR family NAD(P)-dependent oxidoreductase [Mycolicibacterium sp. CBMA 331]MUM01480.1 SDR family NAD(P)-dependent oxidoreductase [Mycolicibacterium sp. CBMA 334]MUM29697.1 SDR family NAD(P)-dependent oxidoreductase [Mycolicibacterium sp. CBMA 295]MUM41781.1 SDR family NAD(P)-dependent oxidoreductase [Mycolic
MNDTADTDRRVVVIFGGRSEIGVELGVRLAAGAIVVLAARRADQLDEQVAAVRAAGAAAVHPLEFDADDVAGHARLVEAIETEHGPIDTAVLAFGVLGDQDRAEVDPVHAVAVVHTDYVAQVSLLTVLAQRMRAAGRGRLVAFSSIAGARARRANYVYGSAKAGLDAFACGLTDALHGTGVQLLIVRPGFVIGRMTQGMEPAPFSSTPAQVAEATAKALARGKRAVWVPWVIRPMIFVTRFVPQAIWRRMPR